MKERYSRFMENITPERSDEELFNAVLTKADKKEKIKMAEKKSLKKAIIIPVAAATAIVFSIAGGAAIYNGSAHLRNSEIAQSPKVAESIQTGVFSDSTDHIRMTVEEYVSDGISAYATVKYEALDDYGKKWLSVSKFEHTDLCLVPCTLEYGSDFGGVSHSYGNFETEELRTETERYFYVEMICSADDYDGGIALKYTMGIGGGLFETPMEKQTVEMKSYALSGDEQASEYFTPTHLKISDLSFAIYGINLGTYVKVERPGYYGIHSTIPEEEQAEVFESLNPTLIMADGERIELKAGGGLGSQDPAEENFYSDLLICSGNYMRVDYEQNKWINYSMDIGEIAGIEMNGVYFEATEIE